MEKELAKFIEDLEFGLSTTKRAEDRKLYETYLAYAACILSKVVLNAPKEELYKAIDTNERLWGNSWLVDPVQGKHPESYMKFKELSGYPGYGNT
jgi:hypothetical protein